LKATQATERFYGLVWPHLDTVLRTARLLTRDEAEADDLAQETMLKAFRFLDRFHDGTDAKAWLMSILRNTRIDRLRASAAGRADVSLEQLDAEPVAAAEPVGADQAWQQPEDVLNAFSDQQVIAALKTLPEDIRWTLLLVDVEGMDHRDAANVLDVPVGTVKSRAHRGRAMLRETLLPVAKKMRLVP
jgi:RNA polymerase sigma-70 factor (ECF subfamily)